MARKAIEIVGASSLSKRLLGVEGRIDPPLRKALSATGVEVRRRMKSGVAKRDGDLARAITMQSRGTRWNRSVVIGPETRKVKPSPGDKRGAAAQVYGAYLEFGTARMPAQPFVQPSLEGADERLAARLNKILEGL